MSRRSDMAAARSLRAVSRRNQPPMRVIDATASRARRAASPGRRGGKAMKRDGLNQLRDKMPWRGRAMRHYCCRRQDAPLRASKREAGMKISPCRPGCAQGEIIAPKPNGQADRGIETDDDNGYADDITAGAWWRHRAAMATRFQDNSAYMKSSSPWLALVATAAPWQLACFIFGYQSASLHGDRLAIAISE